MSPYAKFIIGSAKLMTHQRLTSGNVGWLQVKGDRKEYEQGEIYFECNKEVQTDIVGWACSFLYK